MVICHPPCTELYTYIQIYFILLTFRAYNIAGPEAVRCRMNQKQDTMPIDRLHGLRHRLSFTISFSNIVADDKLTEPGRLREEAGGGGGRKVPLYKFWTFVKVSLLWVS